MTIKSAIDNSFSVLEAVIYVIIALLLLATIIFLIHNVVNLFLNYPASDGFIIWIVTILDRILLMLMVLEIMFTVKISVKEHVLRAEPFFIVAIIAAIRRILIISVEIAYLPEKFDHFMIEISILGGLILIFAFSILMLKRHKLEVK